MRYAAYAAASAVAAAMAVANAYVLYPQFYPAAVYLSRSSASVMVGHGWNGSEALINAFVCVALAIGKAVQLLFFGRLRAIEVEHIHEQTWFSVSETFLAMSIFRDEFDARFVLLYIVLLGVKVFHWLARDRVEFMEQQAPAPRSFYIRMAVLLFAILLPVDWIGMTLAVRQFFISGPTVDLIFGFEYSVLLIAALATGLRFAVHVYTQHHEVAPGREHMFLFYIDLGSDLLKLAANVIFFSVIISHFGLPLHMLRELYMTVNAFLARLRNWARYRRATADMEQLYADVTSTELATADRTCIICREEMTLEEGAEVPKKLHCGHIFHMQCLRSWLERQQSCPTCRRSVFSTPEASIPTADRNVRRDVPLAPRRAQQPAGVQAPPYQYGAAPAQHATQPPRTGEQPTATAAPTSPGVQSPVVTALCSPHLIPIPELVPMVRALQSARAGGASTVTASTTFDPSALVNALSDDQLARFRGIERAAVMSRIQFLVVTERQVRALRERLEQYSSVLDAIVEPDIHAAMERAGVAVPSDAMHSTHSMADSSTAPPEQ